MAKQKVLSFIGYYLPGYKAGGVLRTLSNTVEALNEELDFYIITRDFDQGNKKPFSSIKKNEWNDVGGAKVFYLSESEINIFTFFNLIKSLDFDVYHFNSFFDPKFTFLPFVMRFFGLIKKAPITLAPRGEFTPSALSQKKILKKIILNVFDFFKFPKIITFHASSKIESEQIRSVLTPSFDGVRIAPDIPISHNNLKVRKKDKKLKVISLSRIHKSKGTLEAFKIISKTTRLVHFEVFGPIESLQYWSDCLKIASKFPPNVSYEYKGFIPNSEVKNKFSENDVFLFPTPGENFGHVVAESLSVGTPVIMSDRTPWEGFQEKGIGKIIDLKDLKGFAKEIDNYAEMDSNQFHSVKMNILSQVDQVLNIKCSSKKNLNSFLHSINRFRPLSKQKHYQECISCLMDTTDPSIRFNEDGLCDGCHIFRNLIIPNWKNSDESLAEIESKIKEIKESGRGKKYDCIIGVSGGLDSSYLVYCAVKKLGLRPLLFHCDAGWNTDQAVWNISRLVEGLNLDLYTEVIDWQEMRKLQLAFFESQIPDQDLPQDGAFFSALYKYASRNGIKYVLTGANFSTECSKEPQQWGGYPGIDVILYSDILKRFGGFKLKTFPLVDILVYKIFYRIFYRMQVVRPLNHMKYIKKEAEETLSAELGWRAFPHKHHESRFTRFYEDFWMRTKFGYDRRRSHFSSLILTGQLSKKEAKAMLGEPFLRNEELDREFQYIAHKLEISTSDLRKIYYKKNKTFRDYKNKYDLIILGSVVMRALGLERRRFR